MGIGRRVVLKKTRVGEYYRTTVPEEVRKLLGIAKGDEILWVLEENRVVVEKAVEGGGR